MKAKLEPSEHRGSIGEQPKRGNDRRHLGSAAAFHLSSPLLQALFRHVQ